MMNKKNCNCNCDETSEVNYKYYSKVLNKPFDSVPELREAEKKYYAELKAKEDKAATKKADAKKVEDAFRDLNSARKQYKEKLTQLTEEYTKALTDLKQAFELGKKDIHDTLAAAEDNYAKELKEFTEKYDQYHMTLKGDDFETTISGCRTKNTKKTDSDIVKNLFDLLFSF